LVQLVDENDAATIESAAVIQRRVERSHIETGDRTSSVLCCDSAVVLVDYPLSYLSQHHTFSKTPTHKKRDLESCIFAAQFARLVVSSWVLLMWRFSHDVFIL